MAPLFDKADAPLLKTWVVKRLENKYVTIALWQRGPESCNMIH